MANGTLKQLLTQLSFGKLIGGIALLTLCLALLSHVALFLVARNAIETTKQQSAQTAVANVSNNINQLMELLAQSVAGHAEDPRLATILSQADPAATATEEQRLTREIPKAWLVRLLPENIDSPDETRKPAMGFSDLSMARESVTKKTAPAIHLANSPDAHLAMAQVLAAKGGILHASWPLKIFESPLTDDSACGVELRHESVSLIYRGSGECKERDPDAQRQIPGTPWTLYYWAKPQENLYPLWFVASLFATLLLLAALSILTLRLLYMALRQDRRQMNELAGILLRNDTIKSFTFKLVELEHIAEDLIKLRRQIREIRPPAPKTEPAPSKPVAEKIVEPPVEESAAPDSTASIGTKVSSSLFGAHGIRGIVGETLTADAVYAIALGIGAEMNARGELFVAVARDGRLSSPELGKFLIKGLVDSGRTVINLGMTPTPLMYFATHTLNAQSGVMLTGSHNPANYNGLKIIIAGNVLTAEELQSLHKRIERKDFTFGKGRVNNYNIIPEYIERIVGDTQLGRQMKVVLDCGNSVASLVAPDLMRSIGCDVFEINSEVDGHFPGHHPDPTKPENMQTLIAKVRSTGADLGVAYDGDGDCMGLVDSSGAIIWPDRLLMLFSADVLSREPGADILYDVKCSRHLPSQIVKNGGRPLMWKSGHSHIVTKMKETGAMLAGDLTGHIFFQERWYGFDDGIYASCRMVEILSETSLSSSEMFAALPDSINTPELVVALAEGESEKLMGKLPALVDFPDVRIIDIDGLRIEFVDGWGLVRASNTFPGLTFRFEADSEETLASIQQQFKTLLTRLKPDIELPF